MAKRYPVPRFPTPYGATSVSNTGERQTATHTTGATGSVTNTVRATSSQGAAGAPGRATSTRVNTAASDANAQAAAARKMAAERVDAARKSAGERVAAARSAAASGDVWSTAEAQIEDARRRFHEAGVTHADAALDAAKRQLADARKRVRGD